MKHGDFSLLAEDYAKYRPDYSSIVLKSIIRLSNKPIIEIDAVDVGAGTGIWTQMLSNYGLKTVKAVEPNEKMRLEGQKKSKESQISWHDGTGEQTGLLDNSADILTMASSFHWVNFEKSIKEFNRVLRPNGIFAALWNPRFLNNDPMLLEIEDRLKKLKGSDIKRVSSGRSNFTDNLSAKLEDCSIFKDVIYMEAKHKIKFTRERYLGAWRSVNDLRVQLGEDAFLTFLNWVENRISKVDYIDAMYQTRAWVAKKE